MGGAWFGGFRTGWHLVAVQIGSVGQREVSVTWALGARCADTEGEGRTG